MLRSTSKVIFTGESVVDEKVVCTYNAQIDIANPNNPIFSEVQKDKAMYKEYREVCRADKAHFEDEVFAYQDTLIAAMKELDAVE